MAKMPIHELDVQRDETADERWITLVDKEDPIGTRMGGLRRRVVRAYLDESISSTSTAVTPPPRWVA